MKFVRFRYQDKVSYGTFEENLVRPLLGTPFEDCKLGSQQYQFERVKLLPPVEPTKIIAIGLNYIDHAQELKMSLPEEPLLFMKPPSSVIGPGGRIIYPKECTQLDYEAELAIVIKRVAKNVTEEESPSYILGYTCGNDVTARDLQKKDGQWIRSKGFDTFCPLGPYMVTNINTSNLEIKLLLNGEVRQASSTSHMIFDVNYLVSFISQIMTLYPGDIIMTGTPAGVGWMNPGDIVEVIIEGIGRLKNKVIAEKRSNSENTLY